MATKTYETNRKLSRLPKLKVKGLRAFFSWSYLKFYFIPLTEIFKIEFRSKARTIKEYILIPVIRSDKAKPFIFENFLNCSGHSVPLLYLGKTILIDVRNARLEQHDNVFPIPQLLLPRLTLPTGVQPL